MGTGRTVVWLGLACLATASSAVAQSAANVAVVINDASAASRLVGEYYAQRHDLPAENVLRVRTNATDEVSREVYAVSIEQPLWNQLAQAGLQDRILYVVLTKGVPLRIAGTPGQRGTVASVDSELALLYRRMTRQDVPLIGPADNPYFLGARPLTDAKRFSHREHDIFLVSRLDGFTVSDARGLIDRGAAARSEGQVVLDQSAGATRRIADGWLAEAARRLGELGEGERVLLESSPGPAAPSTGVLGYASWGANDPRLRTRTLPVSFEPGALATIFGGDNARTFAEPPTDWVPMVRATTRDSWFAGSPQDLIGDLIRQGVTGVAGNVAEPLLQGVVRPEILFPAYVSGFNLIESFYLAMPYLSWQGVIVGDPLAAPFTRAPLADEDTNPPIDPTTEFPRFFSERRLAVAAASLAAPAGVTTLVRAEAQLARNDTEGARRSLEALTAAVPGLTGVHLQIAMLADLAGDGDAAIDRYSRVLDANPDHVIALNNLAYRLAVDRQAWDEARPLAERAVELSRRNPNVVDTLAWIEYLSGAYELAATLSREAVAGAPGGPDVRVHAATIALANGSPQAARGHLAEALRLAPELRDREDVIALQAQLQDTSR